MDPKVVSDLIAAGAVALVTRRAIPLLRMTVRLLLDVRRRLRSLERRLPPVTPSVNQDLSDGNLDQSDDLDRAAARALGELEP